MTVLCDKSESHLLNVTVSKRIHGKAKMSITVLNEKNSTFMASATEWFLTWVILPVRGCLGVTIGGQSYWHLVGSGQDVAARHPTRHRTAPKIKNYVVPSVNSAKIEKYYLILLDQLEDVLCLSDFFFLIQPSINLFGIYQFEVSQKGLYDCSTKNLLLQNRLRFAHKSTNKRTANRTISH